MQSHATFSTHSDVLETPVPESKVAKASLLEELKRRGKAAVGAGQWPDAAALYEKALTIDVDDDKGQLAILNSNLSLVHAKMHHLEKALATAKTATEQDPTYVKGWWRLGQACAANQEYKQSVSALEQAAKLEPGNKALQKELDKNRTALTELQKQLKENALNNDKPEKELTSGGQQHSMSTSSTKEPSLMTDKMNVDVDEDEESRLFSKSDAVRGYKIVNGKKTSYFHNELSEDVAKLIGDIAPKKLESIPQPMEIDSTQQQGTSVWNKAGTWEEKDCTKWALETLKEFVMEATYILPNSSPAPNAILSVEKAKATGHASVAAVRGKKRYIYEMDLNIDWKFEHGDVKAAGNMRFPDIDGTCVLGEAYDVSDFTITSTDDSSVRPLLINFCHQQGLRESLHRSIDNWVRKFEETH